MADTGKKIRKCGNCGGVGHDKRKCPDKDVVEKKHNYFEQIYAIEIEEDNGDSVHKSTIVCRSVDGLMKKLKELYDNWTEIYGDDDYEDAGEMKNGVFRRESESFKNVPFPLKSTIEEKVKSSYDNIILQIGDIGSAAGFACKISVTKMKLYD